MNDLVTVFSEIIQKDEAFPVDFDRAWQWIGYSTKQKAKEALERSFVASKDYQINRAVRLVKRVQGGGNKADEIMLSTDCFKSFCMMAGTEKGKEVRRYFIEAEKLLRKVIIDSRAMKIARRSLTDALQISGEADRMHGHAYKTYTDLVYKAVLGMNAKQYRETFNLHPDANVREHLTAAQTDLVRKYEEMVRSMVDLSIPYEQVKTTIETMAIRQTQRKIA